jgi:hypothetical protein
MDWNFLTINGRSGPYTTPLVCKLGERVRIRFINFSTLHQHPMHLHGHTFWITGTEGGRIPESAWIPSNNVVVGVAQSRDVEFIANNPGDWVLHCHMFHHMMNHMVSQVGPIIRQQKNDPGFQVPGYPQIMKGMSSMKMEGMKMDAQPGHEGMPGMKMDDANDYSMKMTMEDMKKLTSRRETQGMREGWYKGVHGLFTVLRVLPPELFDKVMNTNQPIPPNSSTPLNPHGRRHAGHKMDYPKKCRHNGKPHPKTVGIAPYAGPFPDRLSARRRRVPAVGVVAANRDAASNRRRNVAGRDDSGLAGRRRWRAGILHGARSHRERPYPDVLASWLGTGEAEQRGPPSSS